MRKLFIVGATVAVMIAIACSDYGEDHPSAPAAIDSGTSTSLDGAAGASDAGPDAPSVPSNTCDPRAPFEAPVVVSGIPTNAACLTLDPDELSAYYNYESKVWQAKRIGDSFGPGVVVNIEDPTDAGTGCATLANAQIFFERQFNIYRESRGTNGDYSLPVKLPPPNGKILFRPFFHAGTNVLFVNQVNSGSFFTPPFGIVRAPVGPDGVTGGYEPAVEDPIAHVPVVSADGLALYFASSDGDASSHDDIWVATRTNLQAVFEKPTRLDSVNSAEATDGPSWISADNCRLYFVSTRNSATTYVNFVATRKP